MRKYTIFIVLAGMLLAACSGRGLRPGGPGAPVALNPKTYVIVHGAWGGGWAFREVESLLEAKGHKVYRPTLTGQGERVHLATKEVGLDTHINDVVNTILFEELNDIVLVGHSYGGMVVTGVADRVSDRIARLIYLDAMVPYDGESAASMGSEDGEEPEWIADNKDGFMVPEWVKPDQAPPKDVPHPVKTLRDVISLKNPKRLDIRTDYILTVEKGQKPEEDGFFADSQRAKKAGWPIHYLESDHNPQWSKPKELVDLLDKIAQNQE